MDDYYITKREAYEALRDKLAYSVRGSLLPSQAHLIAKIISDIPAADVVEVVRCKDCKNLYPDDTGKLHWCDCHRMFVGLDDFCNYGKRKDGGENND